MNLSFFIAAENPVKTLAETSHDWIPFYGALLITAITAAVNLFKGRSKGKIDQFQILMDESAELRQELKNQKQALEKEVRELKVEKSGLQQQITDYNAQLDNCKKNIDELQKRFAESQLSLELLQEKLRRSQDIKPI